MKNTTTNLREDLEADELGYVKSILPLCLIIPFVALIYGLLFTFERLIKAFESISQKRGKAATEQRRNNELAHSA